MEWGNHSMLNKLMITMLAGAFTSASVAAFAFDLPDYGSKNFSPAADTPSYFVNESAPVSARTADTTPRDWSAVDGMTSAAAEPARPAHRSSRGHGRYHVAHGSSRYTTAGSSGNVHAPRFVGTRPGAARTTAAKHGKVGAHHAKAAPLSYRA